QMRHWVSKGIEFGSHTRTHRNLASIGRAEMEQEITGSSDDLCKILGSRPLSFAFPFGMRNEESTQCALRTFDLGVTCEEGINQLYGEPYIIKRSMVQAGDSLLDVACRTVFGWNPIERTRARIRLRTRFKQLLGLNIEYSPFFSHRTDESATDPGIPSGP